MKKWFFVFAAVCLLSPAAFASDQCDSGYMQYLNAIKETKKISERQKKKYIPMLEEAYDLCTQDKMEEASKVMDEMKDHFLHDALMNQQQFYGN